MSIFAYNYGKNETLITIYTNTNLVDIVPICQIKFESHDTRMP